MCGIAGIINLKSPSVSVKILEKMSGTLNQRGPDDTGIVSFDHACLAHKRLSIIDLKTGHQPMQSANKRYTLVFNGEIYNFLEIKEKLIKQGVSFTTTSDAEVLLNLYIQKKEACLEELNGMFSFAIWDNETKSLFAARDRMGKKPFYFAQVDNFFIFASELKALLKFPLLKKDICPIALKHFFAYEYIPAPLSIIKNVYKLKQAHFLKYSLKDLITARYWNQPQGSTCSDSLKTAESKIHTLLDNATQYRLIADVPVGVFLSGGIDSSTIVALMAKHRPGKDIKTFAINFKEQSYDESPYSSLIAKKFNTDHHEETLTAKLMLDILPEVLTYLDEPFADGSILPTYLLSHFTRKHVKVALGGDGGDELFAGYPTFYASKFADIYQKSPQALKSLTKKMTALLKASEKNMSLDFKARQFLLGAEYGDVYKNQTWLSAIPPHEENSFYSKNFRNQTIDHNPFDTIKEEMKHCASDYSGDRLWYFYQKFYMCDGILVKVDRASMANSLEVRAPFLDKDVVEYVCSLPYSYKLKGITTKYILKKMALKMLPKEIVKRPKKGFGIPITGWLKNDLKKLMQHTLNKKTIESDDYFSWEYVNNLMTGHFSGKQNNRKPLFALLMFHWWKERFL